MLYETLSLMKSVRNHEYEEFTIEDLIREYQKQANDEIFAEIFIRNFGMIQKVIMKYKTLNEEDKISLCLECLMHSVNTYDFNSSKFISYFITNLTRSFIREYKTQNTDKRKIQYYISTERKNLDCGYQSELKNIDEDYVDLNSDKAFEDLLFKIDFELIYKKLSLTPAEKYFLKCYFENKTTKEIAEGWNVSVSRVHILKNSIRGKLKRYYLQPLQGGG